MSWRREKFYPCWGSNLSHPAHKPKAILTELSYLEIISRATNISEKLNLGLIQFRIFHLLVCNIEIMSNCNVQAFFTCFSVEAM
jgi:hypothetical protein